MAIINHDDIVNIVLLNSKTASEDRNSILEGKDESLNIVKISLIYPTEEMPNYGDIMVIESNLGDNDYSKGCDVKAVALYKNGIFPEALKLCLKELFLFLSKNKIKADIIYVKEPECNLSKIEFIHLSLIFQNAMKDNKCTYTLWLESIERDDVNSLSMETEKNDKKNKDKKKKKKDKKKGKKS